MTEFDFATSIIQRNIKILIVSDYMKINDMVKSSSHISKWINRILRIS